MVKASKPELVRVCGLDADGQKTCMAVELDSIAIKKIAAKKPAGKKPGKKIVANTESVARRSSRKVAAKKPAKKGKKKSRCSCGCED